MNFDQSLNLAINYLRANLVTALWGHPGIGKSALGQLLADKYELLFIDIRLGQIEPVDLNGFAHKDVEARTFDYFPWARFPLQNTPLPHNPKTGRPYKGWLIMFDEVNTAPRQNLAAAYKIFLDRMIGEHKLHKACRLMMGGNLVGEGLAGAIPSPLVSRVAHIVMEADLVPAHRRILGDSIYNFLTNHPKYKYAEESKPNTPFPTFRTWEMAKAYMDANATHGLLLEGLQGIVGTSAAVSYISFQQKEQVLLDTLNGVGAFPLEQSQDMIDYLSSNVLLLERHIHRFQAEWKVIAETTANSIREAAQTA